MHKRLRDLTVTVSGLCMVGLLACTHKDRDDSDRSEVSVTDDVRSEPVVQGSVSRSESAPTKPQKAVRRTEAAAARTSAAVTGGAPLEGSEEEYAADVDAAMGDTPAPAERGDNEASVSVNSDSDNSRVNRLNNGDVGLTADQQGNSKSDIEITRKIRKSITDNKELSIYAHNVKIITRDGRVVLKGPVRSEMERKVIEDTAVTVAGVSNVTSGLEIQAK